MGHWFVYSIGNSNETCVKTQTPISKIYQLFNGRELTQERNGEWYLTEIYPSTRITLDTELCSEIVHGHHYLQEDSGNLFTGEVHYTLQSIKNLETRPYTGPIDTLNKEYRRVILLRLEHEDSGKT